MCCKICHSLRRLGRIIQIYYSAGLVIGPPAHKANPVIGPPKGLQQVSAITRELSEAIWVLNGRNTTSANKIDKYLFEIFTSFYYCTNRHNTL